MTYPLHPQALFIERQNTELEIGLWRRRHTWAKPRKRTSLRLLGRHRFSTVMRAGAAPVSTDDYRPAWNDPLNARTRRCGILLRAPCESQQLPVAQSMICSLALLAGCHGLSELR